MLTKEYRIALPMSVEEYRIAQLYMIQKKSREESQGAGSGVEILINEPYTDGPGGNGQYTHKIYHIGSHLPGWFRAILPKSALRVEEEAWNAYPYTKTIYKCPFIERFVLEIETRYLNDGGEHENVFHLSNAENRGKVVEDIEIDFLDIVKDPIPGGEYKKEEDPRSYVSRKTGRGPLGENWRTEYSQASRDPHSGKRIMCAYKLCKVEFRYWGMQSKIERFIHDVGLRKTMLRAHRQAWAWQDEWYGLQMSDIRRLEHETQMALHEKMGQFSDDEEGGHAGKSNTPTKPVAQLPVMEEHSLSGNAKTNNVDQESQRMSHLGAVRKESWGSMKSSRRSGSAEPKQNLSDWRVESIEQLQTSSSDEEDEFFDAQEDFESNLAKSNPSLFKSSSMEMLTPEEEYVDSVPPPTPNAQSSDMYSSFDKKVEQYKHLQTMGGSHSIDMSLPGTPTMLPSTHSCKTTVLFMVLHGGSVIDTGQDVQGSKHADMSTLKATFETVIRAHYPGIHGHVAIRLIPCPSICSETLHLLASLNPFSFDAQSPLSAESVVTHTTLPIGAISLFATAPPDYMDMVANVIAKGNSIYNEFLRTDEGYGFNGQVCLLGDCIGSVMGYDALCRSHPFYQNRSSSAHYGSHGSLHDNEQGSESDSNHMHKKTNLETIKQMSVSNPDLVNDAPENDQSKYVKSVSIPETESSSKRLMHPTVHTRHASCPSSRRTSTGSQPDLGKFEFEVTDFFLFGSPLAMILAFRRVFLGEEKNNVLPRPVCHQMYNLFHPSDPTASRLEPLLVDRFKNIPPIKVARYQKFPLGDGQSIHLVETIQSNLDQFNDYATSMYSSGEHPPLERRQSNLSIISQISGHGDMTVNSITSISTKWWGNKRLDYALYCPDALHNFPSTALPYLLHASYWESNDVVAFMLRQVVRQQFVVTGPEEGKEVVMFKPSQPREKWLRRRTTIKLRNVAPNHRANDTIVLEDKPQVLTARFMYGPLDMVSLTGEKVDVHIMVKPPDGEWVYFGTEVTESNARFVFNIPPEKKLSQGMYPVKMVVRGDHTSCDCYLTVLPPKTECVVFSIDGSFTASVSIMGKDPKVRAGAVDVVRHWQELGYLILYITARPDMQQKKVVAWLAQHNFPHGMVAFMDGLSADPLRQKGNYLRTLIQEAEIKLHAAYGSSKDISVYQAVGVDPANTYIVGKASKKHHKEAQILSDGYAAHLNDLTSHGGSRAAVGNARMFLRKSCFSLPGQAKQGSKKAARRTTSLPQRGSLREHSPMGKHDMGVTIGVSETGRTILEAGASIGKAVRARGMSPRGKQLTPFRYDSSNV